MTDTVEPVVLGEDNYTAAVRSQLYGQLAAALRYPDTPEAVSWVGSGAAEQELLELLVALDWPELRPVIETAGRPRPHEGEGPNGVDVLHLSLFDSATRRAVVSLSERDHTPHSREALWEELFRCYTHFGLEFDGDGLRDAPDLLSIELEFMHYLSFLEASNPETSRGVVLGQADFLARHLAVWTGRVCEALLERAPETVYGRISRLLEGFVAADHASLTARVSGLRGG